MARKRPLLGGACPTSARILNAEGRQIRALELRKQGLTYSQIGEKLGVAKSTAHDYVAKALADLAEHCKEETEALRALEQMRLDGLYLKDLESLVRAEEVATALKGRIVQGRLNDAGLIRSWARAESVIKGAADGCCNISARRSKLCGLDAAEKVDVNGIAEIHFDKEDEDL